MITICTVLCTCVYESCRCTYSQMMSYHDQVHCHPTTRKIQETCTLLLRHTRAEYVHKYTHTQLYTHTIIHTHNYTQSTIPHCCFLLSWPSWRVLRVPVLLYALLLVLLLLHQRTVCGFVHACVYVEVCGWKCVCVYVDNRLCACVHSLTT